MPNELKPCPFCGGEAEIVFSGTPCYGGFIVVKCKTCLAGTKGSYYRGEPIDDIPLENTIGGVREKERWNRRANNA